MVELYADPSDHDLNAAVFPVLRFTTAQGRTVAARGAMGNYPPRYRVGQRVQVWYNPASPHRLKVVGLFDQLFELAAALVIGLVGY